MDDSSIVSVLQEDLQNYKVKTQIRRKESQLHVLITRAEGDDLDYGAIYDIVKRRIDTLTIDGADSLIVYGRLAGARYPEWQKTGEIKPPLPLIELDLDDLEDLGDIGNITFPIAVSELEVAANKNLNLDQVDDVFAEREGNREGDFSNEDISDDIGDEIGNEIGDRDDEYHNFKNTIANDLEIATNFDLSDIDAPYPAAIATANLSSPDVAEDSSKFATGNFDTGNFDTGNFDLAALQIGDVSLNNGKNAFKNALELDPLPKNIALPEIDNDITLGQELANMGLNADLGFDATTVAVPRPLPPPPTKHKKADDQSKKEIQEPETQKIKKPSSKLPILSIAFATGAIAILGTCGWLIWDRSVQQNYLETARNLENQNLNPAKITQINELIASRNQIQTAIAQLQTIPNRPVSLYGSAQQEIANLQPKLQAFDQRVDLEQTANKNLELGKNTTLEAAKLTLNAPHHSKVWKSAQAKRQEALKILEQIPPDSLIYADVQARIKTYRNELTQISKWVDIQQRAESLAVNVSPEVVNQLKQIKTKAADKSQFLNQCRPLLQRQIEASDAQRLGMSLDNLNGYLCAYFWD